VSNKKRGFGDSREGLNFLVAREDEEEKMLKQAIVLSLQSVQVAERRMTVFYVMKALNKQ